MDGPDGLGGWEMPAGDSGEVEGDAQGAVELGQFGRGELADVLAQVHLGQTVASYGLCQ
jgi:hypothetical protein